MSHFNDDIKLVQANDTIMEVYHKILAYCHPTKEVDNAMSKLLEAKFWLNHQLMQPRSASFGNATLSDNNEDTNQKQTLFDFDTNVGGELTTIKEEPLKQYYADSNIQLGTKLPTREEVVFMAKEYAKKYGEEAFFKVLDSFGATKISEFYVKCGDTAVIDLVNKIRI